MADWLDKSLMGRKRDNDVNTSKPADTSGISDIYAEWQKTKQPQHMTNILNKLRPTINSAITTYGAAGNPLIMSKAKRLAIDAVKSYDPKSKASLPSWVALNLQGINRYKHELAPIPVPERARLEHANILKSTADFRDIHNRDPNDEELADHMGLSVSRINHIRKLNRPIMNEGQYSQQESEDSNTFAPGITTDKWEKLWLEYVYNDLDHVNKTLFDMRLGRGKYAGKKLSVNDMAKELGITPAAISQRSGRMADKLAEGFNYEDKL